MERARNHTRRKYGKPDKHPTEIDQRKIDTLKKDTLHSKITRSFQRDLFNMMTNVFVRVLSNGVLLIRRPCIIPLTFFITSAAIVAVSGCASVQPVSPFQTRIDSLGFTVEQVRLENMENARRIALIVESSSDSVAALADDPDVKQMALLWKSSIVPAFRTALFFWEPVAASLDGLTLAIQMRQYFETGNGKKLFGKQQGIVVRSAYSIESLFFISESSSTVKEKLEEWAESHPIENIHFDRASVIPDLKVLRLGSESSISGAVGDISQNIRDISERLNLYLMQLPKEARWQAEYLLSEMQVNGRLDSLEAQAVSLVLMANRLSTAFEEGKIAIDIKSLRDLHADIVRLENQISLERGIVLADVSRERVETIKELERISNDMLQKGMADGVDLVDHLMLRIAQVAGLLLLAIGIMAIFVIILVRKRPQ